MTIFEMTPQAILPVEQSSFANHGILEADLQRLLKDRITAIAPETYVIAEEYSAWTDANRSIDLLCIDKEANLVVVELKRTEDGGHMELQAIRYAAMVSAMTFAQAVEAHSRYLKKIGRTDDPRAAMLNFLEWPEPRDDFAQNVRIVLVSAEFSKEITTAVLWLRKSDLDIRCVRLRPYKIGQHTILDVQQVLPLPEAADFLVQLRKKEVEQREAKESSDWTRYDLQIGNQVRGALYKRHLAFWIVHALIQCGATPEELMKIVPAGKFLRVPGDLNADEFRAAVANMKTPYGAPYDLRRYFCESDELFVVGGATYALSNQWSRYDLPMFDKLVADYPSASMKYTPSLT